MNAEEAHTVYGWEDVTYLQYLFIKSEWSKPSEFVVGNLLALTI